MIFSLISHECIRISDSEVNSEKGIKLNLLKLFLSSIYGVLKSVKFYFCMFKQIRNFNRYKRKILLLHRSVIYMYKYLLQTLGKAVTI